MSDDIRPDPTGYRIEQEGDRWTAFRLVDNSRVGKTYATREDAIAATDKDRDDPEEPREL